MGTLPKEYQQLLFVETTGTQYFNTGFKSNNNTRIQCHIDLLTTGAVWAGIWGARDNSNNTVENTLWFSNNVLYYYFCNAPASAQMNITTPPDSFIIDANKNIITINGTVLTVAASTFQNVNNLFISAVSEHTSGAANYYASEKIRYFKIYDNGTLIRDYIPVLKISTKQLGLYDLVNDVFLLPSGTGALKPGPIFDKNTLLLLHGEELIDSSGSNVPLNSMDITLSSEQKKFGKRSMKFKGVANSSYIRFPQNKVPFGSGDFTIDWWEYALSTDPGNRFYSTYNEVGGLMLGYRGNVVYCGNGAGNWNLISSSAMLSGTPNTWVHWAFVRNNGTLTSYRNGKKFASVSCNGVIYSNPNGIMTIGEYHSSDPAPFNGYIDEFRISDIARWTHDFNPPSIPYDVVYQQEFNTGDLLLLHAEDLKDSSKNNCAITTNGGVSVSTTQHKFGTKSFYFDGTGYLTVSKLQNAFSGTKDWTIDWWEYITEAVGGSASISMANTPGVGYGILFGYQSGNSSLEYMDGGNNSWGLLSSGPGGTITLNTWVHRAIVKSGSSLTAFENGIKKNTWSTGAGSVNSTSQFHIGAYDYGAKAKIKGYIDELRVSSIAQWYNDFIPPQEPYSNISSAPDYGIGGNDSDTVLLLHFDGNFTDSSKNHCAPIQVVNPIYTTNAPAKFGKSSLQCMNNTNCVYYDVRNVLNGDWTFEWWENWNGTNGSGYVHLSPSGVDGNGVICHNIGDGSQVGIWAGTNNGWNLLQSWDSGMRRTANVWKHYALVHASGVLKCYENGVLKNQANLPNMSFANTQCFIGGRSVAMNQGAYAYFDEVRVSNIARYSANFTPQTKQFEIDTNTLLLCHYDESMNPTGGHAPPPVILSGAPVICDPPPKFGNQCFKATTGNEGVGYKLNQKITTGDWTIDWWEYWTETGVDSQGYMYLSNEAGNEAYGTLCHTLGGNNKLGIWSGQNGSWGHLNSWVSNMTKLPRQWVHRALVHYNQVLYCYQDGKLISQVALPNYDVGNNALYINGRPPYAAQSFGGYIDEVRVSKCARWVSEFLPPAGPYEGKQLDIKFKLNGAWKNAEAAYIKTGGAWKEITEIHPKVNGVWESQ